jgi:hypothetical protein
LLPSGIASERAIVADMFSARAGRARPRRAVCNHPRIAADGVKVVEVEVSISASRARPRGGFH